jgi:hypothetical protein
VVDPNTATVSELDRPAKVTDAPDEHASAQASARCGSPVFLAGLARLPRWGMSALFSSWDIISAGVIKVNDGSSSVAGTVAGDRTTAVVALLQITVKQGVSKRRYLRLLAASLASVLLGFAIQAWW